MYLWLEEMGLINQPKETKKEKLRRFEDYLNSIAARNKLTLISKNDNFESRGKAV